jgi:SET domain-containing protein
MGTIGLIRSMLLVATRLAPSPIHGIGVFAASSIAVGTPIWRFEPGLDLDLDPALAVDLPEHARTFLAHFAYVDRYINRLILCFDNGRFVNHSDDPNILCDYSQDRFGIDIAARDIAAGEEITTDYTDFEDLEPPQ